MVYFTIILPLVANVIDFYGKLEGTFSPYIDPMGFSLHFSDHT